VRERIQQDGATVREKNLGAKVRIKPKCSLSKVYMPLRDARLTAFVAPRHFDE
jgi:hypothetical protein